MKKNTSEQFNNLSEGFKAVNEMGKIYAKSNEASKKVCTKLKALGENKNISKDYYR